MPRSVFEGSGERRKDFDVTDARGELADMLVALGRIIPGLEPIEAAQARMAAQYLRQVARTLLRRTEGKK